MNGVLFDGVHSFDDLGLILATKTIEPPQTKTNTVSVPFMNGSIDLTEALTHSVYYEERKISLSFRYTDERIYWPSKVSEIENFLHGKRMKIIFEDDPSYYYEGRIEVNNNSSDRNIGILEMECIVDPFKYLLGDDWLWDPFSFETGVIEESPILHIDGTDSVTLNASIPNTYPSFVADSAMTVTFKEKEYNLPEGESILYDIIFDVGENVLTFSGQGTVTVYYRGGSL